MYWEWAVMLQEYAMHFLPFKKVYCGHRLFTLPAVRVAEVPVQTMSDLRAGSNGGPDKRVYKPATPCPRTGWAEQCEPVPLIL